MGPAWMQWVAGLAVFVTSVGVLWTRVVNPIRKAGNRAEAMLPLLVELTETFKNTPHAFKVLDDIIAQFRTDSGSSLRDVVNRLEVAANDNRSLAATLAVGVETSKQLAERDRQEMSRMVLQLDRMATKVDTNVATLIQMQVDTRGVASDLAIAQVAVDGVASDLAESHRRADEVNGPHGAAGDAAARGPTEPPVYPGEVP